MKIKTKVLVHWHMNSWQTKPEWIINSHDMTCCGPEYVVAAKQEIEVEVPDDFDPRPKQIDSLRKKKDEVLAAAQMQVNNIEEQIQRLLCLEYKPEGTLPETECLIHGKLGSTDGKCPRC